MSTDELRAEAETAWESEFGGLNPNLALDRKAYVAGWVDGFESLGERIAELEAERDRLRKALTWAVAQIAGEDPPIYGNVIGNPKHDCEYELNPEKGACDWCDAWGDAVDASLAATEPEPEGEKP